MHLIKRFCHTRVLLTGLLAVCFLLGSIDFSHLQAFAATIPPSWSYGGTENPTQWGELSPDFVRCEVGKDQSPIDIVSTVKGKPTQLVFNYKPTPLVVVNTGHTIQANYASGSTVTIDGKEYALLQFHFHTPSEHTFGGKAAAMELHLVHRNAAGQLAVVGIMIEEGAANPVIDQIWQNIPSSGKTNTVADRSIDASNFLPKRQAYFSYTGSLTTPPCSEGVSWNLLVEPITASEAQIEVFQKFYQMDARPIQPINGRVIESHRK